MPEGALKGCDHSVFFETATGYAPFAFQGSFAEHVQQLVSVPTGLGKTAMAIVGWLWRRHSAISAVKSSTPRRLVYCLPMRVLVEQTRDSALLWLHQIKLLGGTVTISERNGKLIAMGETYKPDWRDPAEVTVHVLMGGEDQDDWDLHPERDAVIIGTQDMLLSRALNRGYAASRARWPMHFGLLNTDCLWVFDEIQLMGSGLATTSQLEAFRHQLGAKDGNGCRSVWMSATLDEKWLETVDFRAALKAMPAGSRLRFGFEAEIKANGLPPEAKKVLEDRWNASKRLEKANASMGETSALAKEIHDCHKPGTRTIVVVNTVRRACELLGALSTRPSDAAAGGKSKGSKKKGSPVPEQVIATPPPRIVLLHSRFRPDDRKQRVNDALVDPPAEGTIVVSTQVIEAGVDVSATTLFTELAPWASLVQRFGRCNRKGENADAEVWWIDVPVSDTASANVSLPYRLDDLKASAERLRSLKNVGLKSLPTVELPYQHTHVIRRKDLIDLFDTTPDLAGNDIDIDRYVREIEDTDVRVFWRAWDRPKGHEPPSDEEPAPRREEICPAPVGDFKDFVKSDQAKGKVYRWNFLDKSWEKAKSETIAPGQVYLVHADAGGYSAEHGLNLKSEATVDPVPPPTGKSGDANDATDDDRLSRIGVWQTIDKHTDEVCRELAAILKAVDIPNADALRAAARWHDWGKAHRAFQEALPQGTTESGKLWAKASGTWKKYREVGRPHFRHELASALAVLRPDVPITEGIRNLVAYLIAAHHGKVRLSIRSLPNEARPRVNGTPQPQKRFARGVWDGDTLPTTALGGGIITPAVALSLEPMELGLCEAEPFVDQPSWAERMIGLRDTLGPFRLAYLEAILRAADMRASAAAEKGNANG